MKPELSEFHQALANAEETTYRETKRKEFKEFMEASPGQKIGKTISFCLSTLLSAWIYSLYPLALLAWLVPGMHVGNGLLIGLLAPILSGIVSGLIELKAINLYGPALVLGGLSLLFPQALSFQSFGSFLLAAGAMTAINLTTGYLLFSWFARLTKSELLFGFVHKKQPWLCTFKLGPLAPMKDDTQGQTEDPAKTTESGSEEN